MTYSISEAITDGQDHLDFLRMLEKEYPNAYKDGNRWCSNSILAVDCDDFWVKGSTVYLCKRFGAGFVFPAGWDGSFELDVMRLHVRGDPVALKACVEFLKAKR